MADLSAAKAVMREINKEMKSDIVILGSDITFQGIPRITSGSLALDVALGGGWPLNQWNEIIGEFSSGKTALVYKTIAANQTLDPEYTTMWVAAEDYVPEYAEKLGVDNERVILVNTNIMEIAYQAVIKGLGSKAFDCVVIDSLPALTPIREDSNDMDEATVGLGALLTGKFFRKQGPNIKRSLIEDERPVAAFMINQYREKIGVMYGDNRTTPGGKGKDFFYFTRVEVRRDEWIEEGTDKTRVGQTIKARTLKNKTFSPQKVATFDFYFDDSINGFKAGDYDHLKQVIGLAIDFGVIVRKGAYYSIPSISEFEQVQGRAPLLDALRKNKELSDSVSEEVLSIVTKGPKRNLGGSEDKKIEETGTTGSRIVRS